MKAKKLIAGIAALAMALPLTACGETVNFAENRNTVKVYCWSDHMIYNGYAEYVQSQIPDADVVFVNGQNNMAYYEFMDQNDSLPDIITVRRMSLLDAEKLRGSLMDLSETEAAAGFNNLYLENYRFEDGSINWLPACGEVDGYIANLDLFEKYNIELPTDRKSFEEMCAKFSEAGIMPYSVDLGMDYSCLQTLQGLSIPEFMTAEGISWRTAYESGTTHELDGVIWKNAFTRLSDMLKVWNVNPDFAVSNYDTMVEPFFEGKAALMRGTGNDVIAFNKNGMNVCMLPYFGETSDENWLLTYPSFNVAVNKKVAADKEHEELVMRVLDVMFSEGAQSVLAGNHDMIPYNTGVNLELDPSMNNLVPYITTNRLYLRLASNEIFRISKDTVGRMVTGELTADAAYEEFNRQLKDSTDDKEQVVAHFDKGYKNIFDPTKGNEAASAVTNTLRNYFKSDIVIAHGTCFSGIVYNSDYTERQLMYMITDSTTRDYSKELKGSEIKYLIENMLANKYGNIYGSMGMINRYSLPCASGCELTVKYTEDSGYTLEKITVDGNPIDDDGIYKFTLIANMNIGIGMLDELWADEGGAEAWDVTEDDIQHHWIRCIVGDKENPPIPLSEPTDYLDLIS